MLQTVYKDLTLTALTAFDGHLASVSYPSPFKICAKPIIDQMQLHIQSEITLDWSEV